MLAGAVKLVPGAGELKLTLGASLEFDHASTSTKRLYEYKDSVTKTRMRSVLTAGKLKLLQTLLLPLTFPSCTVIQVVPFQYWTWYLVIPNRVNTKL